MRLTVGNPMTRVVLAVLVFEAICFGLAIPGMIQVSGLSTGLAFGLGLSGVLLCLAAAGLLRRSIGWPLAWLTQLAGIALGFAVPMMFAVGIMFMLLFVLSFVLGRRLEQRSSAG